MHPDHEINRASWDQLAAIHGQDAYYDSEALVRGASSLIEEEESALAFALEGKVAGRSVLHVQCHLGCDAITFARRGARVTGADFSSVALARAEALARRCGVDIEWVCADATALPASLSGRFDLAWATVGVLCWIADVDAWMRSVAATLAPGGRLVLLDGHPGAEPRDTTAGGVHPRRGPTRTYAEVGGDYAGTGARTGPQVEFQHSLGDIVSAAAGAGLRVTRLVEHLELSDDLRDETLARDADGRYRRRVDGHPQPVLYTLHATLDP